MSINNYDSGRLNLPFVGISTFAKKKYQEDWDNIEAEVAILGAPFDFGTQFRAGLVLDQGESGKPQPYFRLDMGEHTISKMMPPI